MLIQYGDVILVHGDDPFSQLVQLVTQSYWTHTMLALEPGNFAQMGPHGFVYGRASLNRPYAVLRHKKLLDPNLPEARQILIRMHQAIQELKVNPPRFDYGNLFGLGVKLIGQRMGIFITERRVGPFICSALIDYVYEKAGIDLRPDKDPRETIPANLAELAFGNDPVFKVIYDSRSRKAKY